MRWEYLVRMVSSNSPDKLSEYLGTLGAEGWELVSLQQVGAVEKAGPVSLTGEPDAIPLYQATFKRPVSPAPEE